MRSWCVAILVFTGCVTSDVVDCKLGSETWTCPSRSLCNPARVGCVNAGQLQSCVGSLDGTPCSIGDTAGVCHSEVCETSRCGDGFVIAPEQCDLDALGATPSCTEEQFYDDISAGCRADCTYDYSACTGFCGDLVANGPELCDGTPPQRSCADLGYGGGFLECSALCGPALDGCKELGWSSHVSATSMRGVHGTSDDDVFAVGSNIGEVAVAHFDGSSWIDIDVTTCATSGKEFYLQAVQALGNGKALLAGAEGGVFNYTDSVIVAIDGTTCTRMPVAAGGLILQDVWQISPTNIWAVGQGIYHFDGTSWTLSNASLDFLAVWAAAANDVYAAGGSGLWHFDGSTWTQSPIQSTQATALVGVAANDIYVGGDAGLEHWNGTAWSTPIATPATGLLSLASDGRHVFAATSDGVYVLDGSTWSSLARPDAYEPNVYSVWASSQGTVFSTSTSRTERYAGGATSMKQIEGSGRELVVADANTAYALTSDAFYVYDGGSWTADAQPGFGVSYEFSSYSDIWRSPTDILYFVQSNTVGGAMVTRTPGAPPTWDIVAGGLESASEMWGTADNDIWILGYYGQRLTHWNGTDTELCATCEHLSDQYIQLWGDSASSYFAVGAGGKILHWNGTAWSSMVSGTTATLYAVWGRAGNDVYTIGFNAFLHYNGSAWSALPPVPGRPLTGTLWGTAGNDIFVSTQEGVFHYDGIHWSPVRTALDTRVDVIRGAGTAAFMLDAGTNRTPNEGAALRLVRTTDWAATP